MSVHSRNIIKDGLSDYTISIAGQSTPAMEFAAGELQKYLQQVTGVNLPIVDNVEGPAIVLGMTQPESSLDQFSIVNRDDQVLISGSNSRSVVYGVYSFLESFCTIRFFFPDFESVPEASELVVPSEYCHEECADMTYRQIRTEATMTLEMVDWIAKNRFNTLSANPWDWEANPHVVEACQLRGLHVAVSGHAAHYFLESEKYFAEHPAWFPEVDGQRVPTQNTGDNFCYSQPEAIEECARNIVAFCQKYDNIESLNIWPGDGGAVCQCDRCRTKPFTELFANAVFQIGRVVKEAMPDVRVSQLAYNFNLNDKDCSTLRVTPEYWDLPTMFAFWGQNLAVPLATNPDESHSKVYSYIKEFAEKSGGKAAIFAYHTDTYMNSSMCQVFDSSMKDDFVSFKNLKIDEVCLLWIPWNCAENPFDTKWIAYQNGGLFGRLAMRADFDVETYRKEYFRVCFGKDQAGLGGKLWKALNAALGRLSLEIFPFATPRISDAWGCGFNREVLKWGLDTDYGQAGAARLDAFREVSKQLETLKDEVMRLDSDSLPQCGRFKEYVTHCEQRVKGLSLIFQSQYAMQAHRWAEAEQLLKQAIATGMPDELPQTRFWLEYCQGQQLEC